MDELLVEFLTETGENLAALDIELVKLEQDPNAPGLLANIFRLVHTVKGTSGFFGLPRLEMLAHAAESVLGRFRDGELVVTPPAITVILAATDGIKVILAALEATEREPEGDDATLIAQLNALAEGKVPVSAPHDTEATEQPVETPPRPADTGEQLVQVTDRPNVTIEQRPLDVAEPAVAPIGEQALDITQQPVPTSALQLDETRETIPYPSELLQQVIALDLTGGPLSSTHYSNVIPYGLRNPRSEVWNLEVDRQVTSDFLVRVGYQQRNTVRDFFLDPASFGPTGILGLSDRGSNIYKELQVAGRYRIRHSTLNASYVRSRAYGDLNDFNQFFGNTPQAVIQSNQRGRLSFDAPNRFLAWGEIAAPWKLPIVPRSPI